MIVLNVFIILCTRTLFNIMFDSAVYPSYNTKDDPTDFNIKQIGTHRRTKTEALRLKLSVML